jgi:ComF family protein
MEAGESMNFLSQFPQAWTGRDCELCGAPGGRDFVCAGCAADLPPLGEHCPRCALPNPAGAVCGACLRRAPHFDATFALWRYEFPCDRLVQSLKFRARLALAGSFGDRLALRSQARADLVLPMPLHPRRLAARGFNQALEIARSLARRCGIALEARGVRRVKDTAPQTGLPYDRRAKNVRGAFACDLDLAGKAVVVVDDVMTTGATLDELARVLKRAGAARVENRVVARTVLR